MRTATQWLIVANVFVFLVEQTVGPSLINSLALWVDPAAPFAVLLNAPWQVVTYSVLHANLLHLGLNMFGLWMFGTGVEQVWDASRVAVAYFASVVTGALVNLAAAAVFGGIGGPVIGASAGVFGLMLCYALMFPHRQVMLLFPPIPMTARTMVIGYAAIELFFGVTGTAAGVAHFAHLGGLVGGGLVYRYGWRLSRRRRR
jgi:membrane associated rhomboid family serine protease